MKNKKKAFMSQPKLHAEKYRRQQHRESIKAGSREAMQDTLLYLSPLWLSSGTNSHYWSWGHTGETSAFPRLLKSQAEEEEEEEEEEKEVQWGARKNNQINTPEN